MRKKDSDLKQRMRAAGISYQEIAIVSGFTYPAVANWVNGNSRMPSDVRQKIEEMIAERQGLQVVN